MPKNSGNIRIGPVDVYADDVLIGHTKGGVEFSTEREFEDLTVDEYGSSALDKALTGTKLTIKTMLAEITTENLALAIPEGKHDVGVNDSKLGIGRKAGFLLGNSAVELRLHPTGKPDNERDEDVYIWKAVSTESVELAYKIDEQRIIEITFEALVDESQEDGYYLGRIGDADIS